MLIELPFRISDEIARRLGILAMSRETRGKQLDYLSERLFIEDGRANFVKLILLSKNLNYYQEDLIDSEAPKSRKVNSQTLSKGLRKNLAKIVVSGFRIVDLEFLLFQFMKGCQNYQKNISLCDIEKETTVCLLDFGRVLFQ